MKNIEQNATVCGGVDGTRRVRTIAHERPFDATEHHDPTRRHGLWSSIRTHAKPLPRIFAGYVWVTCLLLAAFGAGIAAQARGFGFYNPVADGAVVPTPATAYLTCYPIDERFVLASANTARRDILATFVQRTNGTDTKVCFLRPPLQNGGDWELVTAGAQAPSPAVPTTEVACPAGFILGIYGGCVPPDHPLAKR